MLVLNVGLDVAVKELQALPSFAVFAALVFDAELPGNNPSAWCEEGATKSRSGESLAAENCGTELMAPKWEADVMFKNCDAELTV
jgi:hypothetical protein